MIISRTPLRISFFGGGTDYPIWFKEHGGAVLATTIDKYCYVAVRYRPPYFDDNFRIVYSKEECVSALDEIKIPTVREILKFYKVERGHEIIHYSDLPARKGLGTSSAFAVGLLNSLYTLWRKPNSSHLLATMATFVEQELVRDNVGNQDQWLAAHGGFQYVEFLPSGAVLADSVPYGELEKYIMLFDTGITRIASTVALGIVEGIPRRNRALPRMRQMVDEGIDILQNKDYEDFGKLLHECWWYKKKLYSGITTPLIDSIYDTGIKAGALGGKLIGAGGGGFMLFIVNPDMQKNIRRALSDFKYVPIKFTNKGSKIIYNGFSSS